MKHRTDTMRFDLQRMCKIANALIRVLPIAYMSAKKNKGIRFKVSFFYKELEDDLPIQ